MLTVHHFLLNDDTQRLKNVIELDYSDNFYVVHLSGFGNSSFNILVAHENKDDALISALDYAKEKLKFDFESQTSIIQKVDINNVQFYQNKKYIKYIQFELVNNTDVWGNKKDGWEVNNICRSHFLVMDKYDLSSKYILKCLKDMDFINKGVRTTQLILRNDYPLIEIENKKDFFPIGYLMAKE